MKRFIIILLAIAVCLSFSACDDDDSDWQSEKYSKYRKYDDILDNLEGGKYQDAIDLIVSMAEENNNSNDDSGSSVVSDDVSKEPELTDIQLSWKNKIIGNWIPNEYAAKEEHTGFDINEDGTCAIDGKDYTWQIADALENSASINVFDGESKVYNVKFSLDSDYGYTKALLYISTENLTQSTSGTYYRSDDYTVIEINNDNWQEYFEIAELLSASKNAFDEISDVHSYTYFRLKDNCGIANFDLSSGGLEHEYISTCQDVTVDVANMTYTVVGEVRNTTKHSDTEKLGSATDCKGMKYFGSNIGSFWAHDVNKNPTDTVWRPVDIEILRIECTLYIVKE